MTRRRIRSTRKTDGIIAYNLNIWCYDGYQRLRIIQRNMNGVALYYDVWKGTWMEQEADRKKLFSYKIMGTLPFMLYLNIFSASLFWMADDNLDDWLIDWWLQLFFSIEISVSMTDTFPDTARRKPGYLSYYRAHRTMAARRKNTNWDVGDQNSGSSGISPCRRTAWSWRLLLHRFATTIVLATFPLRFAGEKVALTQKPGNDLGSQRINTLIRGRRRRTGLRFWSDRQWFQH